MIAPEGMTEATKLVASILEDSTDSLASRARSGAAGADLVELRVDAIPRPELENLRAAVGGGAILTCRSRKEGGRFRGSERERLALLRHALTLGFDYVDMEVAALVTPPPKEKTRLILSHHDLERIPPHAEELVAGALALGADVVKIAARVRSLSEALELSRLGDRVREAGKLYVPVPLGPAGVAARILTARLGGDFAYATARGGEATGAGQVSLEEMVSLYRFAMIGPETRIYGILGTHARESRSPWMHNRYFEHIEENAVYVPFEEEDLEAFIDGAKTLGISGLSVTLPFKEKILPFLDEVDETAARIGAVNTVVVRDGVWTGYNTDKDGVLEPLEKLMDLRSKRAIVVGAGGAARAAAFALTEAGATLRVLARRRERAQVLAGELGSEAGELSELSSTPWDILVNATPLGSAGETIPLGAIEPGALVLDMVSATESTPLIRRARDAGASTVTGIEMLAAQAVRQAELWTGGRPRTELMKRCARRFGSGNRYSRQILFQEIGEEGQRRIETKRVLVVGVGALGSVSSEMMVRAGVGELHIVDRDYVDESNLQRQSLFDEDDWQDGLPKAVAASRKLSRINSEVSILSTVADVHAGNVSSLMEGVDLVLDGTDNFETRYLVNDASVKSGTPWIYAACVGSYGMSFVVIPGETPCLRCFMEDEPPPGTSPTCDTAGVIAPVVHAVAAFQVAEALKILAGRKDALSGEMLSLDVWQGRVDRFRPASPRSECPACGRREWAYLGGDQGSRAVTLCGRNAVQVRPSTTRPVELEEIAARLQKLGDVTVNPYLMRAKLEGCELVLFKDGRAIVHGTDDPSEARTLYARYVGS